jgi:hypothetical protein
MDRATGSPAPAVPPGSAAPVSRAQRVAPTVQPSASLPVPAGAPIQPIEAFRLPESIVRVQGASTRHGAAIRRPGAAEE